MVLVRILKRQRSSWLIAILAAGTGFAADQDLRLIEAAKSQDRAAIHRLIEQHVDTNAAAGDGATALHWAAYEGDLETADALLKAGAKSNVANDLGATPLWLACASGNGALVEKILAAGADPNVTTINGETPLMAAARTGNAQAAAALLAHGAHVNTRENVSGQTALMWAVSQRHSQLTALLLSHDADFRIRSQSAEHLVFTGEPSGAGRNPREIIKTVPKGGSTALMFAARQGDIASARLLLEAGADANDLGPDGMTVLVLAAISGQGGIAALLLDHGADPNAAGAGYAALHAAVLRGDTELVKALLAHGANANARITKPTPVTREGQDFVFPASLVGATPFFLAARFVEPAILRALLAAGADPRLALKDGTTALMAAAGVSWAAGVDRRNATVLDSSMPQDEDAAVEATKVILEGDIDINAANDTGDTVVHGAAAKGYNRIISLLAERGVRLDIKNKRGRTPLAITLAPPSAGSAYAQPVLRSTAELLRKLGAKE